jgi:hypothetical protein
MKKGVEGCRTTFDGADVKYFLWGGCKLYAASGVGWRVPSGFGSASWPFYGRGGLQEGSGDPVVKACDGGDDEALRLLCFRLLEGAFFRIPTDQEFLHVGGLFILCNAAGRASLQNLDDASVVAVGVAAPEGFPGDGRFPFKGRFPLFRPPLSGCGEVAYDFRLVFRRSCLGGGWGPGKGALDGVLAGGPLQR